MKFKSVVWASTIDYPNEVSTVLFVGTCNWNCAYCYNNTLVDKQDIDFETQILPRLLDRKEFIKHIIISGGECTLYSELESTIDILNNNGFIVGIHSNGSKPNIIKKILPKISFIGMDIKCSPKNYHVFFNQDIAPIWSSITYVLRSKIQSEFRTTFYPEFFIEKRDWIDTANFLKMNKIKQWIIQEYTNDFNKNLITPYTKNKIREIVKECNTILPTILKGDNNET